MHQRRFGQTNASLRGVVTLTGEVTPLHGVTVRIVELGRAGLCQVKAESDTMDGWNHFIEGIAFHLKSSVTPFGCTIGSR